MTASPSTSVPSPLRSARDDDRLDGTLRTILSGLGLDVAGDMPPVTRDDPRDDQLEFARGVEVAFEDLYAALADGPLRDDVAVESLEMATPDGRSVEARVYRPAGPASPMPGIVYLHGGGMAMLTAHNAVHARWCADLAASGAVVIGVDFRNAAGVRGPHPFPAGLDDCSDAIDWIDQHRADLGITSLVVQGESGGANLAIASAIRAKREGRASAIDGVYAAVPCISGAFGWDVEKRAATYPSLVHHDGYVVNCAMSDVLAVLYDPTGAHATDPLCWPSHATREDLEGLPPHVVTVNELDMFRDEGLAYHAALQAAGVPVVGRINLGLTHAAELMHADHPAYAQAVAQVVAFAQEAAARRDA